MFAYVVGVHNRTKNDVNSKYLCIEKQARKYVHMRSIFMNSKHFIFKLLLHSSYYL